MDESFIFKQKKLVNVLYIYIYIKQLDLRVVLHFNPKNN